MNRKQIIRLTESQLRQIIKESVRRIVKESIDENADKIQDAIRELMSYAQTHNLADDYYSVEDASAFETKNYEYCVRVEITEHPRYTNGGYDIEGDVDFNIGDIYCYENHGNEVCPNLADYLSKEQWHTLYNSFQFDPDDFVMGDDEMDRLDLADERYHQRKDDGYYD